MATGSETQLIIKKGSIADENADIIVNTVGGDLDFSQGAVSSSILQKAGQKVQDEAKQKAPNGIGVGQFVTTSGGNMACLCIIHLRVPVWDDGQGKDNCIKVLYSSFLTCLKEAHESQFSTIAIPALGSGNCKYPHGIVAKCAIQALIDFVKVPGNTPLKECRFIIYPKDDSVHKEFMDVIKSKGLATSDPGDELLLQLERLMGLMLLGQVIDDVAALQKAKPTRPAPPVPGLRRRQSAGIIANSSGDEVYINCSTTGGVILRVLTGDITKETTTDVVVNGRGPGTDLSQGQVSNAIRKAAGQNLIQEFESKGGIKKEGVLITQAGDLPCSYVLHLDVNMLEENGTWKDGVIKCLQGVENLQVQSVAFPALGTGEMKKDPKEMAQTLIHAIAEFIRQKNPSHIRLVHVIIFQPSMLDEYRSQMIKAANTKLATVPRNWTSGTAGTTNKNKRYQASILKSTSQEYKYVSDSFFKTVQGKTIVKIERIENQMLYNAYVIRRDAMTQQNVPGTVNERKLFHGTALDAVEPINTYGFNRSYCGKHGTVFGRGVYFAVEAKYSAQGRYCQADSKGHNYMYYSMVLTGDYVNGDSSMTTPPLRNDPENPAAHYDSTCDDDSNPSVFAIYYDNQAYPEYLITFK